MKTAFHNAIFSSPQYFQFADRLANWIFWRTGTAQHARNSGNAAVCQFAAFFGELRRTGARSPFFSSPHIYMWRTGELAPKPRSWQAVPACWKVAP
jgi:hypothetical protein